MNLFPNNSKSIVRNFIALFISLFIVWGCGLMEIKEQIEIVDNTGVLKGKVIVKSNQKGPVVVVQFRHLGRQPKAFSLLLR